MSRRTRADGLVDAGTDPLAAVLAEERATTVREEARRLLRPVERTVLHLLYREGRTHREIARLLGMAEGTVRSHSFRAVEKLRRSDLLRALRKG